MNGSAAAPHVATVTLPPGLDVSLVGSPAAPVTPLTPATRQRKYNFSFREKELLVSLIERHGGVVESRTGDGVTIEQKVAAWADVQTGFNQLNGPAQERSVTELKKCYWNLKQKTKKALDAGREASAAGVSAKIDRVLWRIAQLAPEQFEGLLDMHCEIVDATPESEAKVPIKSEKWDMSGHLYAPIKQDSLDLSDREASNASRAESPERSRSAPSPTDELDMYPVIPSDFLSVEMSSSSPQQQQQQQAQQQQQQAQQQAPVPALVPTSQQAAQMASMAEQWRAAASLWKPPGLPELHRLVNGHGPGPGMAAAAAAAAAAFGQGLSALATARPRPMPLPVAPEPPAPPAPERRGVKRPPPDPEDAGLELRRLEHEYKMRLLRQEAECMEARHALQMQVLEQQRAFWMEALARARRGESVLPPSLGM